MPHDIGPELRLARPRTHHGYVSAVPRSKPPSGSYRSASASGSRKTEPETSTTPNEGDYNIELLEYEWPDLPPIIDMKDAVCRKRVSQGINYILPVDKSNNSINNKFRTDLRAMFQEPYATEGTTYDDNRIIQSAKVHFTTNAVDTRWTTEQMISVPVCLNSESENARKMYAHSAPAGGRSRSTMDPEKVQPRSGLFLPIKTSAHPEGQKIRRKMERISIPYMVDQEIDTDRGTSKKETVSKVGKDNVGKTKGRSEASGKDKNAQPRRSVTKFRASVSEQSSPLVPEKRAVKFSAEDFNSYDQLRNAKPPKNWIPDMFKSEHLSKEKNQSIWDWLHYGESITDFEYFLSVCG
ncbi:uncharacterized protein LOC128212034 [Mya arenaria]|uniref:uncharacterized protein LOC128212034 n=1 Tax=Mya arenaria TaxID=6604 RepID=UPI0022E00B96|nr:uncharacterized protein LOC128212034 [Mya arenaria]XP_052773215.1 uncharacterized protein LOC128212034 [Mya arenaria]XP_052773216.1 uncharacterized protein LOC128212034 [Mya arenaria]XP_052773217.1 uncharacterized protein LOC128212034 [Mya arenaria]XP_052773218.1 uncharacterized protein LOC128212034 [Mya arenaria]XP_052773220.1 uncharacterized protein LOC128212034 [Mya arenaria]